MDYLPEQPGDDLLPETFCEMKEKRRQAILSRRRLTPSAYLPSRLPLAPAKMNTRRIGFRQ